MAAAFTPASILSRHQRSSSLNIAVDPEVASKKEYQDVCGVDFDDVGLAEKLERTKFLYPKHVEVIADFDDVVDSMVDNVVSSDP